MLAVESEWEKKKEKDNQPGISLFQRNAKAKIRLILII